MQTPPYDENIIAELFDCQPEAVIWYLPVWSAEGSAPRQVIDFELRYCNDETCRVLDLPREQLIGQRLLTSPHTPEAQRQEFFQQFLHIWQTGERQTSNVYLQKAHRYVEAIRSKVKGGIISLARDRTREYLAEQERAQHADLLASIIDASINGLFALEAVRDADSRIIDFRFLKINQQFADVVGRREEDIIGKSYLALLPPSRDNGLFDLKCRVVETGVPIQKEIYYNGAGINGWYNISISRLGANGVVETFTDITESKRDKEAAQQSAERLHTVLNTSQVGVFMGTPVCDEGGGIVDFRFTLVNRVLAAFTGQEPEALIGEMGSRWFGRYRSNGLFDVLKDSYLNGTIHRFDFYYEGTRSDAWINIMTAKVGGEVLGTFTDFTPIKKLQQEVERSADRLSTVINTAQAGMFTLAPVRDATGNITDFRFGIVNQSVASYIGETAERLTGALGSIYFPAYKSNGLFNIYLDTYTNNTTHQFDFHYEDGYDVYFNIHTVKMGDEVLVTFTDHTTLKRLQRELEASVEELKRSNAGLEEFAYVASHDLQEPLRKIHFFSERLKQKIENRLDAEDARVFERIESATARMRQLIDDLLTYSKVSIRPQTFSQTDLKVVMDGVLHDLEASIAEKSAVVTVDTLPVVQGDEVQLRQLFQNLISNALKYAKPDVPPEVRVTSKLIQKAEDHEEYHQICIADNGIGFEQNEAAQIFKVFHRLHGRSEYQGTGIGLAIVHKVVQNHQGSITAEGAPGKGAVFCVCLPHQPVQ